MTLRARAVVDACRVIARFSEDPENITRTYLSPPTHQVHHFLNAWMNRLGMETRVDAAGNLRGLHRGRQPGSPRLLIGSHIDTVPNGGAFDGVLGVVMGLSLIEGLGGHRLDYGVEVIAFSEEEGVRFGVPFIGSRALVGDIDDALLRQQDRQGISLADAIAQFGLNPSELAGALLHPDTFAYLEFHIEQGPVLEDLNTGLGIVESIAGQSRYNLTFYGQANHAGTIPMRLRYDALAGAAEWILAVERLALATPGLVATTGRLQVLPGAVNVIPGEVSVSLDIRHPTNSARLEAIQSLLSIADRIASARALSLHTIQHFDQSAIAMDPVLAKALESAAVRTGAAPRHLVSGAGHDAGMIARNIPSAMLFVRSPGGISHHPDETVREDDVQAALETGLYFLKHLDPAAVAAKTLQDASETPP